MADRNRHCHSLGSAADPLFERAVVDLRTAISAPFALGMLATRPWRLHPAAADAACDQHANRRGPAGRQEPLWGGPDCAVEAVAVAWGVAGDGSADRMDSRLHWRPF